jgi:hypothetical protein
MKHKNHKLNFKTDQKGQALLFVLVAMTIALAIGINISVRTLSSVSRSARSDTAERVRGAAEGAIERALSAPVVRLNALAQPGGHNLTNCRNANLMGYDSVTGRCLVEFPATWTDDNIDARALVTVESFNETSLGAYTFQVEQGQAVEVNLNGYTGTNVTICWNPLGNTGSDLYYTIYRSNGITAKGGITSGAINTPYVPTDFLGTTSPPKPGFSYCRADIGTGTNPYGLRIMSLGLSSEVGVFAQTNHSLPVQGFLITATGELVQEGVVKVSRDVIVYRSYPFLPSIFDFAIYAESGL